MQRHPYVNRATEGKNLPLEGIRACVFDAYGTLFDHASAALRCRDALGDKLEELVSVWRTKQLQYTWLRSLQSRHADFWQVTGDALDFALETVGIEDRGVRERLMNLYLRLEPFPDVPEALTRLKAAGLTTAILSNGTHAMLEAAVNSAGLGGLIDAIYSVDTVGVFKPHPNVYRLATAGLGMPADAIAFQSANAWDAYAASAFGMRVVWCNRSRQQPERLPGRPDREIESLVELPQLVGA
jgi:2-haloacid dehalogenase